MKQKGLAPILIVLLIAIIAAFGGFLFYSTQVKPTLSPKNTLHTPKPTQIPSSTPDTSNTKKESSFSAKEKEARSVVDRYGAAIMKIPGVVCIGVGLSADERNPVIEVCVIKLTDEIKQKIPTEIEGVPVKIDETGQIIAL